MLFTIDCREMYKFAITMSLLILHAATSQQATTQRCFPDSADCTGFSFHKDSACYCSVDRGQSYKDLSGNCVNPSCSEGKKWLLVCMTGRAV